MTVNTPSGRVKIDTGTNQSTVVSEATGASLDAPLEAFRWKGTHASNSVYAIGGNTGVATTRPTEVATVATWAVQGQNTVLDIGAGVTQTTGTLTNGTANINSAATTITVNSGTLTAQGTGKITTLTVSAGALCYLNNRPLSGAAADTINISGAVDASTNPQPFTLTNAPNMYSGSTLSLFSKTQAQLVGPASLQIALVQCGIGDVTISAGSNITLTLA